MLQGHGQKSSYIKNTYNGIWTETNKSSQNPLFFQYWVPVSPPPAPMVIATALGAPGPTAGIVVDAGINPGIFDATPPV